MHSEQFSFEMNLASCCSELMDFSESVDVLMSVMPPICVLEHDDFGVVSALVTVNDA